MFQLNKRTLSTGTGAGAFAFAFAFAFALAICSFTSALYFSFQGGCAGDVKAGVFGNPSMALEFENFAFSILFFGLIFGSFAIALKTSGLAQRIANGISFVVIGFILFWLLSWQIEALVVKSCFKP